MKDTKDYSLRVTRDKEYGNVTISFWGTNVELMNVVITVEHAADAKEIMGVILDQILT